MSRKKRHHKKSHHKPTHKPAPAARKKRRHHKAHKQPKAESAHRPRRTTRSHAVAKHKKKGKGRGKRSFNISRPGFIDSFIFQQGAAVTVGASATELTVWGIRKVLKKFAFVQSPWGGFLVSLIVGVPLGYGARRASRKYGNAVALGCIGSSGTRLINNIRLEVTKRMKTLPPGQVAGDAEGVNGRYELGDGEEISGTKIRTSTGELIEV